MGEYAQKGDRRIKLGTCEDLFYVTREDVVALKAAGWEGDGGAKDLGIYLREKSSRFRLALWPEPVGDPDTIDARKPEGPSIRIPIELDSALCDMLNDDVEHNECYTGLSHGYKASPGLQARLVHPCPLSRKWRTAESLCRFELCPGVRAVSPWVDLAWEGAGNGRAVYRCPVCGEIFNLYSPNEKEAQLRALMLDAYRATYPTAGLNTAYIEGMITAAPAAALVA